VLKEGYQRGL